MMGSGGGLFAVNPDAAHVATEAERYARHEHRASSLAWMLPRRPAREEGGIGVRGWLAAMLQRAPSRLVSGALRRRPSRGSAHLRAPTLASGLTTAAMVLPVLAAESGSERREPRA